MGNSQYSTFVLIALMVFAFYFLIIRPNKKRQQAQLQTMNSLQPGTRVLMTSGIFGTIVEIGEKQAVLELSSGVHLTILKQAIARAVKPGDEDEAYEDEAFDEDEDTFHHDTDPALGGTAAAPVDGIVNPNYSANDAGTSPTSTEGSSAWSADAPNYPPSSTSPSGTDQDPRSGTNTTPIKD